jgi:hypothetical protein
MKTPLFFPKICVLGIALLVLLVGQSAVLGQEGTELPPESTPDMIVTLSEDYLNRVITADLEELGPKGVKDINVQLKENEPIEVNAVLRIGSGLIGIDQNVAVEANVSIVNDTLKIKPEVLKVGFLNLPEETWVGPIKSALEEVEVAANDAYQNALAKGYKVTGVTTGNNTMTLSVMAPDKPFEKE